VAANGGSARFLLLNLGFCRSAPLKIKGGGKRRGHQHSESKAGRDLRSKSLQRRGGAGAISRTFLPFIYAAGCCAAAFAFAAKRGSMGRSGDRTGCGCLFGRCWL